MPTVDDAPARRAVARVRVRRLRNGAETERTDRLATEEPMEIRLAGPGQEPVAVAVTMRTPGDDFELAVGFLVTEGVITAAADVVAVAYCSDAEQRYNAVTVRVRRPVDPATLARNVFASSSCGICGKATLDAVEVRCAPLAPGPVVSRSALLALPERMRAGQRVFAATGGLHAAALADPEGRVAVLREDVGRHNAVDKVVGHALMAGAGAGGRILMVSGRLSFEIVQKAAVAGVPVVCAVSAPSSLAVEAAERLGVTAIGFLRGDGFNLYAHPERVADA